VDPPLKCPFCHGPAFLYRRGARWRIVIDHLADCVTRTDPSSLWVVNGLLIDAAFGDALAVTGEEFEVAHRVTGAS
jgi:hypothetical protein